MGGKLSDGGGATSPPHVVGPRQIQANSRGGGANESLVYFFINLFYRQQDGWHVTSNWPRSELEGGQVKANRRGGAATWGGGR